MVHQDGGKCVPEDEKKGTEKLWVQILAFLYLLPKHNFFRGLAPIHRSTKTSLGSQNI